FVDLLLHEVANARQPARPFVTSVEVHAVPRLVIDLGADLSDLIFELEVPAVARPAWQISPANQLAAFELNLDVVVPLSLLERPPDEHRRDRRRSTIVLE